MAVVGSVQILLDVNTARMSHFTRAAATVARDSDRMRRSMVKVGSGFTDSMRSAGQAAVAFNGHLGGMGNRMRSLSLLFSAVDTTAVAAGAGFATAAAGLGLFISRADRMKRAENDLRTVTTGVSNLAEVQKELFEISQRSRSPMEGAIKLYARTARALEHVGTSQKDVLRITETVQKAFAVGGASPAEAMGAAIQLSQGIASNRFSGEEYRSVSENAPVLLRAMADQLGVNIGKLREMAYAGKLTGEVVAKAILGASDAIDKKFGKTVSTVGQSFSRVNNAFDQYVYETDKVYGITDKLAGVINYLADNFDSLGSAIETVGIAAATFAIGRLGSAAVGSKGAEGEVGGLRGVVGNLREHGIFYGVRKQAKQDAATARQLMKDISKERKKIAGEISAIQQESNSRLTDLAATRSGKLAKLRENEIAAHQKINDLTGEQVRLTGYLSSAQQKIVQNLKAEQAEALKAMKSQHMTSINASRRYQRSGKKGDFNRDVSAQKKLNKARERYREITERVAAAQSNAFDDKTLRKYGAELRQVEKELKSNSAAMVKARQNFATANASYIAAQREGGTYLQIANAEREKASRLIANLESQQLDLNKRYEDAGRSLLMANRRMSLLGATAVRVGGFLRGMWGLLGGGPGVALMAVFGGFLAIQNSIAKSERETEQWKATLREAGYLADDVAESAGSIDEAITTKNATALRLELEKTQEQIEKIRDGGILADIGLTAPGIKQLSDNVGNQIERLLLIKESFERRGAVVPNQITSDLTDFLRFQEIINGAKESGEVTSDLNDELQDLANKHNILDPWLDTFRGLVKVIDAGVKRANDLKNGLQSIGSQANTIPTPAWLQQLVEEEARQKANKPFFDEMDRQRGLSDYDKDIEKRAEKIMKAAKKAKKDITEFEARAAARMDKAAEAANKGLRDLIGFYEGTDKGRGYNETLGYGRFTGGDVNLTQMTLREVLALQKRMLAHPDNHFNSSAVGRYQITSETLRDMMGRLNLSSDTFFSPEVQDRIADEIIRTTGGDISKLRGRWTGLENAPASQIQMASNETFSDLAAVDPKVMKYIEGLKDLRLDALASGMDEWNQKIVQSAQSLGVSREEVDQYIQAVTSGDLKDVPAVFLEIAAAQEQAAHNNFLKDLKDLKLDSAVATLSEVDQQLVEMARSAGMAYPVIQALIEKLKNGGGSALTGDLKDARDELQRISRMDFAKDALKGFFSDFISGIENGKSAWESFGDAAIGVLDKITDKLLDMITNQLISGIFGGSKSSGGGFGSLLGGLGSLFGLGGGGGFTGWETAVTSAIPGLWNDGGYTGRGSRNKVAGLVHKGEVVWSQDDIRRAGGVAVVEGWRRGLKGYAGGGVAGPMPSIPLPANSNAPQGYNDNRKYHIDARGAQKGVGAEIRKALEDYDRKQAPLTWHRINDDRRGR